MRQFDSKQSKYALNIDSNGHQKTKEQKNTKNVNKTTKNPAQKTCFLTSLRTAGRTVNRKHQNVSWHIFYKTRPILIKFCACFPD